MAEISKVKLPNNTEYDIRDTSKQPILVSGTNIKTVNSTSLLGEGNLSVGTVTSVQAGTGLSISGTSTVNPTVNIGSNYKLPTTNEWNAKAPLASPALTGTPTAPTADAGTNTTQIATTAFVKTAIDNLPEPMLFKGSVGTDGTVTWANLPSAAAGNEGWTYKVITAHSADTKCPACKVGDTIISNGSAWTVIPSGDEPYGTVTSVGLSAPTGFSVSGSPITSSGTLALSFTSGYSLPTTAKQSNWDTAYGWGNHATQGYLKSVNLTEHAKTTDAANVGQTLVSKLDGNDIIYEWKSLGSNAYTSTAYVAKAGDTMTGTLRLSGSKSTSSSWDPAVVIGADGHNKLVLSYLASNTNTATVAAHASDLNAWAPLYIGGTEVHMGIEQNKVVTISSAKNVGIGTTSPTHKLHVNGGGIGTSHYVAAGTYLQSIDGNVYFGGSSGARCHQQYDSTNKCLKFIFD